MGATDIAHAHAAGEQFPMARRLDEALPLLRRPFTASAVRAKVQTQHRGNRPKWGQVVRYIDARLVHERLNLVVGGGWTCAFAPLDPALRSVVREDEEPLLFVVCRLTVLGQTHEDVGEGHDPKAAFSDAVKRAAVPFGIGRSLYAVPARYLYAEESRRPPRDKLKRRGERLYVTPDNEAFLREEYEAWLHEVGIDAFGEPLDHGPDRAGEEDGEQDEEPAGPTGDVRPEAAVTEPARHGLRAVSDGRPGPAPATIREREGLLRLVAEAGLTRETVGELSGLVLEQRFLDRLAPDQVGQLAALVARVRHAGLDQAALARELRAAREGRGRRDAAAALLGRLEQLEQLGQSAHGATVDAGGREAA